MSRLCLHQNFVNGCRAAMAPKEVREHYTPVDFDSGTHGRDELSLLLRRDPCPQALNRPSSCVSSALPRRRSSPRPGVTYMNLTEGEQYIPRFLTGGFPGTIRRLRHIQPARGADLQAGSGRRRLAAEIALRPAANPHRHVPSFRRPGAVGLRAALCRGRLPSDRHRVVPH